MKDKIIKIGQELYEELDALYHTPDGTSNKYNATMNKGGIFKFIEIFATRIEEEVGNKWMSWVDENAQRAFDKMGYPGDDVFKVDEESYQFGYYRALEDFQDKFLPPNPKSKK